MENRVLFEQLTQQLSVQLFKNSELQDLTSNADSSMIENQLKNFLFFYINSIERDDIKILQKVLPWMYHAYHSQGYKYEYFLLTYTVLEDILKEFFQKEQYIHAHNILETIHSSHEDLIVQAVNYKSYGIQTPEQYKELQLKFKNALLSADSLGAKEIFNTNVQSFEDLFLFYGFIIYPAMIEVGLAWEEGIISPAQEHLASSIVLEILSLLYTKIELPKITKGKVLVSTVTNEFHEIGAIMLANGFEADGWDVTYLGCDVLTEEFLAKIQEIKPFIVALSVSMPFNIDNTETLISKIKKNNPDIKVMVGGNAFTLVKIDEDKLGADIYLKDIQEAIKIANEWYEV